MNELNRRHFFKKTALALVSAAVAKDALAASACKTAEKEIKKEKVKGYSEDYVKDGKLGYAAESPEKKAAKGKICSNCKHFCAEKKVCTLASMLLKKKEGEKKIKYFPLVHEKGYCNMFAWEKAKKKEWKAAKKA